MNYTKRGYDLQRKLNFWQKRKTMKGGKFIFLYVLFLLILAYIIDEICTGINGIMEKEVIDTFFGGKENQYIIITSLCMIVQAFSFLYKSLADKYGRKPFIVINTLGFAAGLFVCFLAKSMPIYLIGLTTLYFFSPCDAQTVYIIEIAPSKNRGFFLTFVEGMSILGTVLIPSLRNWASGLGNWQYIFLVPACIAVALAIAVFFLIPESEVFLKNKVNTIKNEIKFIENPASEYAKRVEEKGNNGFINALKYTFKNKTFTWLFIVGVIISLSGVGYSYKILILNEASLTSEEITQATLIYPITYALFEIGIGYLTDKIGRKKAAFFAGVFAMVSFLFYIVSVKVRYSPYVMGMFLGMYAAGYFTILDIFNIICGELAPTKIRASLISVLSLSLTAGGITTTGLIIIITAGYESMDYAFFALLVTIPSLFFSLLILLTKIPEPNNIEELQIEQEINFNNVEVKDKNNDGIKENKTSKTI